MQKAQLFLLGSLTAGLVLGAVFANWAGPLFVVAFAAIIGLAWAAILKNKETTISFGVAALFRGPLVPTAEIPASEVVTAFWCAVALAVGLFGGFAWRAYA